MPWQTIHANPAAKKSTTKNGKAGAVCHVVEHDRWAGRRWSADTKRVQLIGSCAWPLEPTTNANPPCNPQSEVVTRDPTNQSVLWPEDLVFLTADILGPLCQHADSHQKRQRAQVQAHTAGAVAKCIQLRLTRTSSHCATELAWDGDIWSANNSSPIMRSAIVHKKKITMHCVRTMEAQGRANSKTIAMAPTTTQTGILTIARALPNGRDWEQPRLPVGCCLIRTVPRGALALQLPASAQRLTKRCTTSQPSRPNSPVPTARSILGCLTSRGETLSPSYLHPPPTPCTAQSRWRPESNTSVVVNPLRMRFWRMVATSRRTSVDRSATLSQWGGAKVVCRHPGHSGRAVPGGPCSREGRSLRKSSQPPCPP